MERVEIEARAYGPGLTADEKAAIQARITLLAPRVVLFHEVPVQSPTSVDITHDAYVHLVGDVGRFVLVLDLRDAKRPDPATRAALRRRVAPIAPRVAHLAIVLGGNIVMSAVARLVTYSLGYRSVSTHSDLEDAVARAQSAL